MFKYLYLIFRVGPFVIIDYFWWMLRYSWHPEKYARELRYNRVRNLILRLTRALHIEVIGENLHYFNDGQIYYIVGNHFSYMDPLMLIVLNEKPITFVSKIEVMKYPFIGRLLRIIEGTFIDRNNLKQEVKVVRTVKASLEKKDISWSIFAEGTRNRDVNAPLRDFRGGTFKIAYDTKTTILPVTLYGTHYPLSTKYQWKWYPIQVHVYPPIPFSDYQHKNTNEIAREIQDLMQAGVNTLRIRNETLIKDVHKKLKK